MADRWGTSWEQSIGHGGKVRGSSAQSGVFYNAYGGPATINTCQMRGSTPTLLQWPIDGAPCSSNLSAMVAKCGAEVPNLSAIAVKELVSGRSGDPPAARGARSPTGHRTRIQLKNQKMYYKQNNFAS